MPARRFCELRESEGLRNRLRRRISGIHGCAGGGAGAYAGIVDAAEAGPLMCAGVTTFNALRHSGALPSDLVAVQGIGGLGHLGVQFAQKFGYRVAAIGRGPENAALAKKLGAKHVHRQRGNRCGGGIAEAGRSARDSGDGAQIKGDDR